jgi:choline dehydrogenase-like flavoprotein
MLIDATALSADQRLEVDVCVVGAGPAGLTVAGELERAGVDCLVVEAGAVEAVPDDDGHDERHRRDDRTAAGRRAEPERGGETAGHPYFRLDRTRAAGFGGTSRLWPPADALRCRRLDAVDFEERREIGRGGWPFGLSDLVAHYERAEELLALPADDDPGHWEASSGAPRLPLSPSRVDTVMARFAPVDVFRTQLDHVRASPRLRLLAGASVVELEADEAGRRAHSARVALAPGRYVHVVARRFVLAGGAIETARLLLASRRGPGPALGDPHGLVGRFFMEHLHTWSAALHPSPDAWRHARLYERHRSPIGDAMGLLTFPADVLRAEALPNVGIFFHAVPAARTGTVAVALHGVHRAVAYRRWPPPSGTARRVAQLVRRPGATVAAARAWRTGGPAERFDLMVMSEQLPSPRSRVTLADRRDHLGMPLARLDWAVDDADRDTVARAQHLLAESLEQAGLGVVTGFADELDPPPLSSGGYHHLGTTRMDPDPARGVVDADGRVHELTNLYVTGGSVFPTGGFTNPTLTIVALAVRLARHLADDGGIRVASPTAWSESPADR